MAATMCPACDIRLTSSEALTGECPSCGGPVATHQPAVEAPVSRRRNDATSRPAIVKVALGLLVASLVIGLVKELVSPASIDVPGTPTPPRAMVLAIMVLTLAFLVFLFWLISTGRFWALIVTVVLTVVGTPTTLNLLVEFYKSDQLSFWVMSGQTVMQFVAFVMLFTPAARGWFQAMRRKREYA